MNICLTMITYNRLEYTRRAISHLLKDKNEEFELYIWDNNSTDGTVEYLKKEINDSRISDIIFSNENVGQVFPVNKIWSNSKADLLGKLDNDCIVTPGWTRTLAQAHYDIPELGVVACWHYFPDDFDYERAKHKIFEFNGHKILRHANTCGTGFLIKHETYNKLGPMTGNSTTAYWWKMAKAGYINGFYYPFIYQEHMDDPKSKYTMLKDEASYRSAKELSYTINTLNINTLSARWQRRADILDNLLEGPWDVKYYIGWRSKINNMIRRLKKIR